MKTAFFTVAKPWFEGVGAHQIEAIRSWSRGQPDDRIVLGADSGVAELAGLVGARHSPDIFYNRWNTPLVSSVFGKACELTDADVLVFLSSDVTVSERLGTVIHGIAQQCPRFLVGAAVRSGSRDQEPEKPRILAFPRQQFRCFPTTPIGRPQWWSELFLSALIEEIPIVDISQAIRAEHIPHGHTHSCWGTRERLVRGVEGQRRKGYFTVPDEFSWLSLASVVMDEQADVRQSSGRDRVPTQIRQAIESIQKERFSIAEKLRDRALELDREGHSDEALEKIRETLSLVPSFPGARLVEALCLMNLCQFREAEEAAGSLLSDPTFRASAVNLCALIDVRKNDFLQGRLQPRISPAE